MAEKILALLVLILPAGLLAQVNDNFRDEEYPSDYAWKGTTEKFSVNFCGYPASNSSSFRLHDFVTGEIIEDLPPPEVSRLRVLSPFQLEVSFNEVIDSVSCQTLTNYHVTNGVGNPFAAIADESHPGKIILFFPVNFLENMPYEISIGNLKDYHGNILNPFTADFIYHVPRKLDVVFNELMVDPDPPVALPPYEYIELFNTSGFDTDLEGWILQVGNKQYNLPSAVIPAEGYLLLSSPGAQPSLLPFGDVLPLEGFSETALINAGTDLMLFDRNGDLISFVSYSPGWYQNPAKENGGWSLEKADPYNFCQGIENWCASADEKGGSPGEENSVREPVYDTTAPELVRSGYVSPDTIVLHFSEPMNEEQICLKENYLISPYDKQGNADFPESARPLLPDYSRVSLTLNKPLSPGIIYSVVVNQEIEDCQGNALADNTTRVAIPETADSLDIVINEILFNPSEGGARYVELFNRRAGKVIELKDHIISAMDTLNNFLESIKEISSESYLFFPGDYVVVTPDPRAVKKHYMTNNPHGFIRTDGFPSMGNYDGIFVLSGKNHRITDRLIYHEDMHFPLLSQKKGVSLERLNPELPTQDDSNWHSAASTAGFGTPAYRNSQQSSLQENPEAQVIVFPEVFSPDGDGHEDLLNIEFSLGKPGYVANIRIFDSRGRLVCSLKQGELLPAKGIVTWCGTTDQKTKAPLGIYIIHLELFDTSGNVRHFKKTAVVAGKID